MAVAGNTSLVASMAGLRLPIESHVLQAFVSEAVKPFLPGVVTFGAGHFYISQSDKGTLVFGGDIDGYNSYAQRGNLPAVEDVCESGMALMPLLGRLRVLRSWGGIVDMSMDGSPIIDRTPLDGLYLNGGWNYGGFKATPASGWCFAHLLAHDASAPARRRIPSRPLRHRPPDRRKGPGREPEPALTPSTGKPCAFHARSAVNAIRASSPTWEMPPFGGRRAMRAIAEARLVEAVYLRDNPAGPHDELWYHASGCRSWLRVTRDTRTHEMLAARLVKEVGASDEVPP